MILHDNKYYNDYNDDRRSMIISNINRTNKTYFLSVDRDQS